MTPAEYTALIPLWCRYAGARERTYEAHIEAGGVGGCWSISVLKPPHNGDPVRHCQRCEWREAEPT